MVSCSDVCELVQEMLNGQGFTFDDNEASHEDMIQALNQCTLIKDSQARKAVIIVYGGLVNDVISTEPFDYLLIDQDGENFDEDELTEITDEDGDKCYAAITEEKADVNLELVEHYLRQIPPL